MISTLTNSKPETLAQIAEEKHIRKTSSLVLMFSMGSQFDHLIMMQLAKIGVFALVADPSQVTASDVSAINPQGIIVSGGPASVHSEPPPFDNHIFNLGIPVLGICLGFQMWAKYIGLTVQSAEKRDWHIRLAPPALIIWLSDQRISGDGARVCQSIRDRRSMSSVSLRGSVGRYVHVPIVFAYPHVAAPSRDISLQTMPPRRVGDRWHAFSRKSSAPANVVPGCLVHGLAKTGRERARVVPRLGHHEIRNSAAPRTHDSRWYGAPRERTTHGSS